MSNGGKERERESVVYNTIDATLYILHSSLGYHCLTPAAPEAPDLRVLTDLHFETRNAHNVVNGIHVYNHVHVCIIMHADDIPI